MEHKSIWKDHHEAQTFTALDGKVQADITIIGGGITGLTTAYLLSKAGRKVVVIEADRVGGGTTGLSSCHLTTDLDYEYRNVISSFDEETAKLVADSRVEAIGLIETIAQQHHIDCDFRRVPGYLYTETREELKNLEDEFKSASTAGLKVSMTSAVPLPFQTIKGIRFEDQGEFNSYKFCQGLAKVLKQQNCTIYENSRVINIIENDDYCLVGTATAQISSKSVVLATHIPLLFNVLQTTAAPYRSYMLAAKLVAGEAYPEGLFWDTEDPYHYTRTYHAADGPWLVVGGEDHKTGEVIETEEHFKNLEKYIRQRFKIDSIGYSWSAQYYEPSDGLPYIGKNPFSKNTFVATGFSGDGLVNGVVSAVIISDLILGRSNRYHKVFDSTRFTPVASAKDFIKENVNVFKHFIKDRFNLDEVEFENILPEQGKIIEKDGEKLAVARDAHNELHVLSPVCPHLKCFVQWNNGEKSWDCPCHGSRFSISGEVLCGPAVKGLESRNIAQAKH